MSPRWFRPALVLGLVAACAPPSAGGGGDAAGAPDAATPDGGSGDGSSGDGGSGDGGGGDGGGDLVRSCATRFAYRATAAVESVAVAGEWDWNARTAMTDPDGDGVYTAERDLAAGLWAYKLVVTRPGGAVEWLLDPAQPYRAYAGGVENSGVRVGDCALPLAEVTAHTTSASGAETRLHLWRGRGNAELTAVRAHRRFEGADTPVTATLTGSEATIALADLPAGKHTLVIEVEDAAGNVSTPLVLPFWIEAAAFDWRDALIYMVMTDRFVNGDPANDPGPAAGAEAAADFQGGDLRGVTQAIDDGTFDRLGVRALWLSPFVENTGAVEDDGGHGVTAYHGYWPSRARAVDPRLGTAADLDALVTAAHRRGIRVLMDFVINHVHADHEYYASHPGWFRVGCMCGQPGCDWTEHRLDCSFRTYMPDVDWTNREAGEQMIADALWWLERFDLDGLRVDAVKHVEDAAILNLSARVHEAFEQAGTEYFLLGETAMGWNGDDLAANLPEYQTISRYVGPHALSGQFDFVLYHASAYRVWADDQKGMLHLDYWTRQSLAQYPAGAVMTPFVGSHDSERLLSLTDLTSASPLVHHKWASDGLPTAPTRDEPYQRAALALTWMLAVPGAPLLYYGDEYGEHGGADPDNRHMWAAPATRSARQTALHDQVARAGRLRQELAPLRRGTYVPLTVTEDVLTFARVLGDEVVVVGLNRAGAARTVQVDLAGLGGGTLGASLVDRLDPGGRTLPLTGGGLSLDLPARGAAILARP